MQEVPEGSGRYGLEAVKRIQKPRLQTRHAMTLVELLVVLAIIAVVTAVAVPVIIRARSYTQRAVCANNMHQASLAVALYSQDNDSFYPSYLADALSAAHANDLVYWHDRFCQATFLQPNQISWATVTLPYLRISGSPQLSADGSRTPLHCPSDRDLDTRPLTSYEFKMWLAESRNEASVPSAPNMALLWEQWDFHSNTPLSEHDRQAEMNIAFVDGHLRWVRLSELTTARYGDGPDLHWNFQGSGQTAQYSGQDIAF